MCLTTEPCSLVLYPLMVCPLYKLLQFWLVPLHEDSREQFSFTTELGTYTPLRLPQGAKNSATQFQSRMVELFGDLPLIIWIDDVLGYASTSTSLLKLLHEVLRRCEQHNLKINASRTYAASISLTMDFKRYHRLQ
jgi:hypothetical protein